MKIETRYKRITKKMGELAFALKNLQEECEHPNAVGTYDSNTGNWCPADDHYWLECKCPDCGKYWRIDSKDQEYRFWDRNFNRKINRKYG